MEDRARRLSDIEAWSTSRGAPERRQFHIANALINGLHPLWIAFDYLMAPEQWQVLAVLRGADIALGLVLWAVLSQVHARGTTRWLACLRVAATGCVLSYMAAVAGPSYFAYLVGFSLVFWGVGLLWAMPTAWALGVFGTMAATFSLTVFVVGEPGSMAYQYVAGAFYLGSAGVIASVIAHVRVKGERERFFASRELARTNHALSKAVRALEDAQLRMVESEKLMALGRLLAGLSHEINNPLTVIHNNVEPLMEYQRDMAVFIQRAHEHASANDSDPACLQLVAAHEELELDYIREDSRKALQSVADATDRIRSIHGDLRAFIRGESPTMGWTDLNDGIRVTLRMLERGLPPGVKIRSHLSELPAVNVNAGRLNQVVLNLLRNALDAIGPRGTVAIDTRLCDDGAVQITVTDDGPGVPATIADHIFEPFFTTKEVGKGTGLGLSTSYEIIDQHDGRLRLDSSHTSGARFVVTLPTDRASHESDREEVHVHRQSKAV